MGHPLKNNTDAEELLPRLALGEIGLRMVEATWEAAAPKGVVRSAQGVRVKGARGPSGASHRVRAVGKSLEMPVDL
jgi:hypothetical protein